MKPWTDPSRVLGRRCPSNPYGSSGPYTLLGRRVRDPLPAPEVGLDGGFRVPSFQPSAPPPRRRQDPRRKGGSRPPSAWHSPDLQGVPRRGVRSWEPPPPSHPALLPFSPPLHGCLLRSRSTRDQLPARPPRRHLRLRTLRGGTSLAPPAGWKAGEGSPPKGRRRASSRGDPRPPTPP